jgi:hypothetical protein
MRVLYTDLILQVHFISTAAPLAGPNLDNYIIANQYNLRVDQNE